MKELNEDVLCHQVRMIRPRESPLLESVLCNWGGGARLYSEPLMSRIRAQAAGEGGHF